MHEDIPTTRRFVTPAIQRDTYTAIPDKSRYPPRRDARRQQHADTGTEQTQRDGHMAMVRKGIMYRKWKQDMKPYDVEC